MQVLNVLILSKYDPVNDADRDENVLGFFGD